MFHAEANNPDYTTDIITEFGTMIKVLFYRFGLPRFTPLKGVSADVRHKGSERRHL